MSENTTEHKITNDTLTDWIQANLGGMYYGLNRFYTSTKAFPVLFYRILVATKLMDEDDANKSLVDVDMYFLNQPKVFVNYTETILGLSIFFTIVGKIL